MEKKSLEISDVQYGKFSLETEEYNLVFDEDIYNNLLSW